MRSNKRSLPIAVAGISAIASAAAQPKFDAASVKPAGDFVPGSYMQRGDSGHFIYGRIALAGLLVRAYAVERDQIQGPEWIWDAMGNGFSVSATMPPDTTPEQLQVMLQGLLAERFQLKVHHETKYFPGYELMQISGGAKLQQTTQDQSDSSQAVPAFLGFDADGFPKMPAGPGESTRQGKGSERGRFQARSMAEFATSLGYLLHDAPGEDSDAPHPRVADKTGLTAKYDFTLAFDCRGCLGLAGLPAAMRANIPILAGRGAEIPAVANAPDDPGSGLPNIFNALEKQLGLKLEKVKDVPVGILVIDHADKVPTGN